MKQSLDWFWRLLATGAAFAFIFFGGLFMAVFVLPCVLLLHGNNPTSVQNTLRFVFRFYVQTLRFLGALTFIIRNPERFENARGKLVIANHPSLLDVIFLMGLLPKAQCVVKHELWAHPLLGPLVRRAGYIRNDLSPLDFMETCQKALDEGNNLIVFPEGTRSPPEGLLPFHRGFANIALMTKAPVLPVLITCAPPTLVKGEPWWKIPPKRPLFTLEAREDLDITPFLTYPNRGQAARQLTHFIERFYQENLRHG